MQISLSQLGKRFQKDWIFKDVNFEFKQGLFYAITGNNGSGKSTLIKLISGIELPSKGAVKYSLGGKIIEPEKSYKSLTLAAPYQELIEEFTLSEIINFHFSIRKIIPGYSTTELPALWNLKGNEQKLLSNFSSGMKQRVKLGLAFYTEKTCLLLDEPTMNLDDEGAKWFQKQLTLFNKDTLIIMASNEKEEYKNCNKVIDINQFK